MNRKQALVLAMAVSCAAPAWSQDTPKPETLRRGRSAKIEEIVVRARKRDELLQDTPVSVTALSPATLNSEGVTRLDDIQTLIPNTFFQVGRSNQDTNLRMRGVGAGSNEIAFDPGVGVYVDGVFLPRAIGALVELFDVEQIDVLRGPQGTLFGKNTVGGAILVRTVKPKPDFEGSISLNSGFVRDFEDLNSVRVRAMLNIPIYRDKVLSRFSFMSKNSQGYVADASQGSDKSNTASYAFLGSIRLIPTEDLTIDISGTYGRDHNNGRGGQCVFFNENALLKDLIPGFIEECNRSRPLQIDTNFNGISDVESTGAWGTALLDVGSGSLLQDVSIKALGSWRRQLPRIREDLDSTRLRVIEISSVGGELQDGIPGFQQQITSELQFNAGAWNDRIKLVSGAFGQWETGRFEATTTAGGGTLSESTSRTSISNWTWALFGQGTADLTDWFSLTLGGRYTRDKKGLSAFVRDRREAIIDPDLEAAESDTFERWTGMSSAALKAPESILDRLPSVDHLMAYYTFSQGFRGGGFNGILGQEGLEGEPDRLPAFRQETLDNHEFGIKTTLLDERLSLNLAYFYGEYSDVQAVTVRAIEDPGSPTGLRIERITQNAAEATVQGAELEFQAVPIEGLALNGSFGWIDATYDSFEEASDELLFCTPTENAQGLCQRDRSGEGFDRVPRLEASLSIQYEQSIDPYGPEWLDGALIPRFSWSYRDSYHLFSRQVAPLIQHGFHLLNARLTYALNHDTTQVALWGRNLTDEHYFNEGTPIQSSFGSVTRYFAEPRTFGVEISHRF